MYSNWKASFIYYSVAKLIEATVFLITNRVPPTHDSLTNSFYHHLFTRFKDAFYLFPFSASYNLDGLDIDPVAEEYGQFLDTADVNYGRLYTRFLSWFMSSDPVKHIERWLRNRFDAKWMTVFRIERERTKKLKQRDKMVKLITRRNDVDPKPYTLFHCFCDFREWATYREVEPFIHGCQADSKKFVLDISYSWITGTMNFMTELIIFSILPKIFLDISQQFKELICGHFVPNVEGSILSPILLHHTILEDN
jgi:hypothetical protein